MKPRFDRTSCHRWEANQFRLFLHMGAYWLLHELRSAAPKRSIWRTATFETIRCRFLKIAVRIQELKTRIKMALPSALRSSLDRARHLNRRPRTMNDAASAALALSVNHQTRRQCPTAGLAQELRWQLSTLRWLGPTEGYENG
jgi:hypothetical protein